MQMTKPRATKHRGINVSVYLSKEVLIETDKAITRLGRNGVVPSRSQVVRMALLIGLKTLGSGKG
jgi:hypothetical protein